MVEYRIRNWAKFQHYRNRNPPWIKLHFELLSSRDWVALDDASRVLAIACMLLASRNDKEQGVIADDPTYLRRVAYLNQDPDLTPLIECGFLEPLADASIVLASARPEEEEEAEAEKEEDSVPTVLAPPVPRDEMSAFQDSVCETDTEPGLQTPGLQERIFTEGLRELTTRGVVERQARSLLGKWRRDHGDERTMRVMIEMARDGPSEPVSWCERALRGNGMDWEAWKAGHEAD